MTSNTQRIRKSEALLQEGQDAYARVKEAHDFLEEVVWPLEDSLAGILLAIPRHFNTAQHKDSPEVFKTKVAVFFRGFLHLGFGLRTVAHLAGEKGLSTDFDFERLERCERIARAYLLATKTFKPNLEEWSRKADEQYAKGEYLEGDDVQAYIQAKD